MPPMKQTYGGLTIELLVTALSLPALYVGRDYTIVCANEHARSLFARGHGAELTGRDLHPLIFHTDQPESPEHLWMKPLDTEAKTGAAIKLRSPIGICECSVSTIRDANGCEQGYLFQCLNSQELHANIQNEKAASEKTGVSADKASRSTEHQSKINDVPEFLSLAESEWRWKTAILNANHAVWDHDVEQNRHFVSETWRRLRGLTDDDPIPESHSAWLETIHPQDVSSITEKVIRIDAGETDVINYKFRQRHAAGHWVWFLSSGRVVRRDANGLPARMIGTDTDITDIKTVELESQRMAERLNAAMAAARMGRWEFDVGANYAYWDDRILEMFGISDGVNVRSSTAWGAYIHPDDRDRVLALSQQLLERGEDIECDYRHLRKDGSVRHIRTRGKYVEDVEHGARYYGVNFDVTQDYERAQELELARARLEYESRHDALTGLANRRYLDDTFTKLAKNPGHRTSRTAALHFDIDHFKQINDTLGHDAGDATLKHAAEILRVNTPDDALVSRVGGDEFVAFLLDAPDNCVLEDIAENIIRDMSKPFYYGSQQCNIGTSIGIAVSERTETLDNGLFIDADLALYASKKAGRGRYRFFSAEMKREARRRKNSFDALLAGFDQGEITCHYQPQFHAQTLELIGLEALIRWESKEHGLIMPEEFLATAEDMGLVAHFDELVLRKTLYDLGKWNDQGHDIPRISVNVSSHRLNDPTLIERLRPLELPRGKISFELLESAFLDSKNETIERNLKQIEQMGIDIEIDDFGSGHASIVSLLQVAPKRLKIDRCLIQPIVSSRRQRDLIETIVEIGKMLDVNVVAEGVESWEHVRVLQEIGCCFLQGYGLARPMDSNDISALMQELSTNGGRLACG